MTNLGDAIRGIGGQVDAELNAKDSEIAGLESTLAATRTELAATRAELEECRAASAPAKPVPAGLSTSGFSSPFYTPKLRVATLNLYWDAVEPTRGNRNAAVVTDALAAAKAAGVETVRVRPYFGTRAPTWAKAIGDGPITYVEPQGGITDTIPDVWDLEYQAEVEDFDAWLAGLVDDDPFVSLVFATMPMTAFGEPFQRGIPGTGAAQQANRDAIFDAGYSMDADKALQHRGVESMTVFEKTNVGLAYNPWQHASSRTSGGTSLPFTEEVMDHHVETFGARAVLTNHSIRAWYANDPPPLYGLFRERPDQPHQFQSAAKERIAEKTTLTTAQAVRATIEWAIEYVTASVVELYAGGWNELSATDLASFNARLAANVP